MRYTGTSLLTSVCDTQNEPIDGNECRQCTKRVYAIHETSVCDTQRTSASNAHEEDNEAQVVCNESEQWNAQGLCVSQAAMRSKQECDFWCARAACNSQNTGVQEGKAGLDAKQCAKEYRVAAKGEHNL